MKKGAAFYRVFRNLSFGNLPGFLWCEAIRIPAFFIFKKGAGSQLLIFSRSPVTRDIYPEECARYYPSYAAVNDDEALAERVRLLNPLEFIGTEEKNKQAKHYRIRVGAADVDTSLSVSMALALQCCKTVF